ncbi:hypothetical protein PO909_032428 [Leuciscus waleckii]
MSEHVRTPPGPENSSDLRGLTAVVAEIHVAEFYRSISKFRVKEEKLCDFAKRGLQSLTADLRSDIEKSKKERKLLPIKYKLR